MKHANFIDLLPASLKANKDIIKFSSIIDNYLSNIDNIIDKLTIYARLDDSTLEEEYVDALAKTFHLLANESYRFAGTTEQKRELVRNALILHKTKGTKYAVERVCNILDMLLLKKSTSSAIPSNIFLQIQIISQTLSFISNLTTVYFGIYLLVDSDLDSYNFIKLLVRLLTSLFLLKVHQNQIYILYPV